MDRVALSRLGVPVRLTDERWSHIVAEHAELAGMDEAVLETIAEAERVVAGGAGELLAVRAADRGRALVVVYREVSRDDGFVITAFLTSQVAKLLRRRQIWPSLT